MNKKYKTGYATWALLVNEAELYLSQIEDIEEYIQGNEKLDYNILPLNSEKSKKRIASELDKRFKSSKNPSFLRFFIQGNMDDKSLISFYFTSKVYQLIPDFIIDTVLKKWYNMDYELDSYDFKSFIYRKSEHHPELEEMSEKTLSNISGATMKILREVGLLNKNILTKHIFNSEILNEFVKNGDSWFLEILLLNENERQEFIG